MKACVRACVRVCVCEVNEKKDQLRVCVGGGGGGGRERRCKMKKARGCKIAPSG